MESIFNDYQKESTCVFKPIKKLQDQQIRLLDWAIGLGGEAGEVLDLLKHSIFHEDTQLDKMELAKELGDVMWYLSAIATTCGIDLADVALLNRAKLKHRYGEAYSITASANRHANEMKFKDTPIYKCLTARINNTHDAPVNVIVIGPDGSGKTTFTKLLAEKLNMKRIKCDYRQENKPETAKALLAEDINIVYDRFYFPDEIIYSVAKDIPLDEAYQAELKSIWEELKMVNPIFIYVDANMDVLKERSADWADDYVAVSDLQEIKAQYEEFIQSTKVKNIPVIEIDTSNVSLDTTSHDRMIDFVIMEINKYKAIYGTAQICEGEEYL